MQVGWVYLIGNSEQNFWKIGYSIDVEERLRELNDGPFPLSIYRKVEITIPDHAPVGEMCRMVESGLHVFFKALGLHMRGEWFRSVDPNLFVEQAEDNIRGTWEYYESHKELYERIKALHEETVEKAWRP